VYNIIDKIIITQTLSILSVRGYIKLKWSHMENIIYGLKDPRNDVYQYIGKSTVGAKRPLQHLTEHGVASKKVWEWILTLRERGMYPIIQIIERVEDLDKLNEREKHYIRYYHSINSNLLNTQHVNNNEDADYIIKLRDDQDEEKFDTLFWIFFKIPQILKDERIYRKINQEEMSKRIGVSRSTISLLENGNNVNMHTVRDYLLELKNIDLTSFSRLTKRAFKK
jgi:hypothetical protein